MKPSFIGLGAQKCASTWLHRILAVHPQVAVADDKEVDFFSYHFDYGYQWYERQFRTPRAVCVGEVSPSYFHDPRCPGRVRAYRPDMKILLTLRDPVERAISQHRHAVRLGHVSGDDLSFETGLANNPTYVEQGFYAKHLSRWLEHFSREQIYIALVDDVRQDPIRISREVFRFLGVDDCFHPPDAGRKFNPSYANRSQGLVRLKDQVYRFTRSPGMGWLWSAAAGVGARDLYRWFNIAESDDLIPPVGPHTVARLCGVFREDILKLECLLGRDLTDWLAAEPEEALDGVMTGGGE